MNELSKPKKSQDKIFLGLCCLGHEYESSFFPLIQNCLLQLGKAHRDF